MKNTFHGIDINEILKIRGRRGYGVSFALARGDEIETWCCGSGRFGEDFPVNPDMMFQAGSVSKPLFALTLLRYADRGQINLDEDISPVVGDFVKKPVTFSALLSHTAGYSVPGFKGYPSGSPLLTLEDVIAGRGNSPKVCRIRPYGMQYRYSGGGTTLAELAFTRIAGISLREAFEREVAQPLGLTRTGYFQPLDEKFLDNSAFGGRLRERKNEDPVRGYHYYPEHAAAGLWSTPTELAKIGIALSRSLREDGILKTETAKRMMTPVMDGYGLCIRCGGETASHTGRNEGFLTSFRFSMKEELCVVGMVNKSYGSTYSDLNDIGKSLFRCL